MWVLRYYSDIVARAFRDARGFLQQHLVPAFLLVVAGLIVSALVGGISLIPMLLPFAALGVFACIVFLVSLVLAPARLNREKEKQLAKFAAPVVDVVASYPVIHRDPAEQGGFFVAVPGLRITNHSDRALDLDIDLGLMLVDSEASLILPLENDRTPGIQGSLSRSQRGLPQLFQPLRIEGDSRAVGLAVFFVSEKRPGRSVADLDDVESMHILLTDGVNNTLLGEWEVWPSIWPQVLDMAQQQNQEV